MGQTTYAAQTTVFQNVVYVILHSLSDRQQCDAIKWGETS